MTEKIEQASAGVHSCLIAMLDTLTFNDKFIGCSTFLAAEMKNE